MANRESATSWKDFLLRLRDRGLHGTEFVVADDHAGLRAAIREVLTGAAYQRCYVHFLRNALDHLPRKADDDCLQEPRWLYDRRNLAEARADLAQWLARLSAKYPRLSDCDIWFPTGRATEIGRAPVRTPVTNARLVCRLLLAKNITTATDTNHLYTLQLDNN